MAKIETPRGTAYYPSLHKPDQKYDVYKTGLICDPSDPQVQKFIEQLEAMRDAKYDEVVEELVSKNKKALAKKVTKREVYRNEEDEDGEPTGNVVFSIKGAAGGISKKTGKPWKRKIKAFDGKNNELRQMPAIWGGSVVRLFVDASAYYMNSDKSVGVSLKPDAVKILKLVSGGSNVSFSDDDDGEDLSDLNDSFSDDDEADGYEADGDDEDDDEDDDF